MIVSTGRGYVFVHIPKTGGTALALALEDRAMRDDILIGDTPKARKRRRRVQGVQTRGRLWKHSTLADIDGLLPEGQLADLFAFTLVRNPWDRLVSYYHWLQSQTFQHRAVTLSKELDFADFLRQPAIAASFRAAPAAHYMRRSDGVVQCAAYIRIEHFEQDAGPLIALLGFTPAMIRINTSPRRTDYRGHYDDATAAIVAEFCAVDIAAFGYSFDPGPDC